MSERAAGLRFASDSATLAPHVVIGHVDISSAGARVALLLREVLRRWAGPDKTQSHPGAVWATLGGDDNSGAVECARAWESTDPSQQMPPAAPLQVDTFHGSDGAAVLSIVCINAEVPGGSANAIALDLVRKIIADKVSRVSVLAGVRFNPKNRKDEGTAHLLRIRKGIIVKLPENSSPLASWDPVCEINDSLLAGIMQLLSLEHEVEVDCLLAAGYRLPQEVRLNLPLQRADPTPASVMALFDGLQHCNAATAMQAVGGDKTLPWVSNRAGLEALRPACALTEGEFAPFQPDSAAAFYK